MRLTRLLMGMPITVEVVDADSGDLLEGAFGLFEDVDRRFSPYRADSELSRFNRNEVTREDLSPDMRTILDLAEATRRETHGYFNIRRPDGRIDPSGIVKGWAIGRAAELVRRGGARDWFVDAGGDVQCAGHNGNGTAWRVGIRNPFDPREIVKVVAISDGAIATSGTSVRGNHIYNPIAPGVPPAGLVSLTVIAADICDADRFATAAFAMGQDGISFIEQTAGLEGYAISETGVATMTSGFKAHLASC